MTEQITEPRCPVVGEVVEVSTENYQTVDGLVVAVHGKPTFWEHGGSWWMPSINVVFVSPDESKTDGYGRQTDRYSSLCHYDQASNMPKPGRYWQFK